MNLDSFKEKIYKCSGCGQCQSVCPVYKILKSECAVSRGKFKLLNAIVNRDIKLSKKTENILDLCLVCGACKEFCPAGIDAQKIFHAARIDMFNENICSFSKKIIPAFFTNNLFMSVLKFFIDFYRNSGLLNKAEKINKKIFHNKDMSLINDFLKVRVRQFSVSELNNPVMKVAYFKGCVNNYINPSAFNASKNILKKLNVEVIEPKFSCCGLALKNAGNMKLYKKIAGRNIDLIPDDVDYIITDCASCLETLKNYSEILDGSVGQKAVNLKDKFISIYELIEKLEYTFEKDVEYKVVYHNPCANRFNLEKKTICNILKKDRNTRLVETEGDFECCGASMPFAIKNRKLSVEISKNNSKKFIDAGADIILTSCPLCYIGLKQGLLKQKSNIEVMQVIEFIQ